MISRRGTRISRGGRVRENEVVQGVVAAAGAESLAWRAVVCKAWSAALWCMLAAACAQLTRHALLSDKYAEISAA
jgi:predicted secreted protein